MSKGPARGVYQRFAGEMNRRGGLPGNISNSQAYAAAKYWMSQGKYLGTMSKEMITPPNLAQTVLRKRSDLDLTRKYGYVFQIDYVDPTTGKIASMFREVTSYRALSPAQAAAKLRELLTLHASRYEDIMGDLGKIRPDTALTLIKFYKYSYTELF